MRPHLSSNGLGKCIELLIPGAGDSLKARAETLYHTCAQLLEEDGLAPSAHQFAVGMAACHFLLAGSTKQLWSQAPGTGKSRSMLSMVYILAKEYKLK